MISSDSVKIINHLADLALAKNQLLATAESCTGGLIAAALTEVSGSSVWFDRGFVTYSNSAKQQMLGVSGEVLEMHGAVSEATVQAMAQGALERSEATIAISVSGVAGPTGGSDEKPVGTVWIGCAYQMASGAAVVSVVAEHHLFSGDRASVRKQTVDEALQLLIRCIESESL